MSAAARVWSWRSLNERDLSAPRWMSGPLIPAVVAALLGIVGIGAKSLWLDEAFSAAVARRPTLDLAVYLWHNELHASPYYLFLNAWTFLGTSETVLRLPSVIFGVVAVVATYFVARRFGVGFLAALLLAIAPLFVQFEQNVRVYTLLVAWASVSTLAYLRYVERPTRLRAVVYVICGAAMIYMHPVGAFVIGAHALWSLAQPSSAARLRRLALFVSIGIAWLPMVGFMALHRDKISWILPLSGATISDAAIELCGGALAAGALAVLLALRARRDLVTLWLIVPICGALAVSALVQPMLQARYLIVVLPAVAIIVARNRRVAVAVLAALFAIGVFNWYASPAREDWRAADAFVMSETVPGDGIVFSPTYARLPLDYYGPVADPLYAPIAWTGVDLPGIVPHGGVPDTYDNPRIWLVEIHGPPLPADVQAALAPYSAVMVRDFGPDGPRISLLVLDAPGQP